MTKCHPKLSECSPILYVGGLLQKKKMQSCQVVGNAYKYKLLQVSQNKFLAYKYKLLRVSRNKFPI